MDTPSPKASTDSSPPLRKRGSGGSRKHRGVDTSTSDASGVLGSLPAWWRERAVLAGLDGAWLDLTSALTAKMPAAVRSGGGDLLSGVTPDAVGDAYVNALSAAVRAHNGRHYTPLRLAEELWAQTRRSLKLPGEPAPLPGRVHDPAVGGGVLLLPVVREHLAATRSWDPQERIDSLRDLVSGGDLDADAVYLANVVLAAELLPVLAEVPEASRRPLPALCEVRDALTGMPARTRAIVMNPPYGRVTLSKPERERFADTLYGHANLYGLFMAAAADSLDEEGVIAALVPTSFMAGLYFQRLRSRLAVDVPLREVAFVADRSGVFSTGVLQETCLATFARGSKHGVVASRISGGSIERFRRMALAAEAAPWILPRRSEDAALAVNANQMPETFASLGWKVSTGPLVWNRKKSQIHESAQGDAVKIVWGADVDGGSVHQDPSRDKQRFFELLTPSDKTVLVLFEPAVLLQRTTSPEQARRLSAALLDADVLARWGGRVVVENHVNVATCSPESLLRPELMARVLATHTMDRVLRCITGSVAVSAYEIEAIPFPGVEVVATWQGLHGQALEEAVADAYGL